MLEPFKSCLGFSTFVFFFFGFFCVYMMHINPVRFDIYSEKGVFGVRWNFHTCLILLQLKLSLAMSFIDVNRTHTHTQILDHSVDSIFYFFLLVCSCLVPRNSMISMYRIFRFRLFFLTISSNDHRFLLKW